MRTWRSPSAASRSVRVRVERGSMPYSAVTQPRPVLRRNGGTRSSTVAVHSTCVSPNFAKHEPSAYLENPVSSDTARIASKARPEGRIYFSLSSAAAHPCRLRRQRIMSKQTALAGQGAFGSGRTARPGQGTRHHIDLAVVEFKL